MRLFKHVLLLLALSAASLLSAQTEKYREVDSEGIPVVESPAVEEATEATDEPQTRLTDDYQPVTEYPPVTQRPVRDDQWKKAAESLDYSNDLPKKQKEYQRRNREFNPKLPDWSFDGAWWGQFFQWLAIGLLVVIVAWGVYKMLQQPRNRSVVASDGTLITIENLEDYLHETDLERFLREALSSGNYTQAVRVYYLQIIKELSAKEAIVWSREKTNRDYLREMRSHVLSEPFRTSTNTYERVWYGNRTLTSEEYSPVEHQMRDLLERI